MSGTVHQLEAGMPPAAMPAKKEGRYNLILMTDDDPGIFVFEMSEAQAESLANANGLRSWKLKNDPLRPRGTLRAAPEMVGTPPPVSDEEKVALT